MATDLSEKLLTYLATHVKKKDRLNCSLVCKQWTEPFLNAYWAKVEIGNWNIEKIFDEFGPKEVYQKNAYRVWALDIKLYKHSFKHIQLLQQTYSRIKYLSWRVDLEKLAGGKIDWSIWGTLSHLELSFTGVQLAPETTFEEFSALSCLVHFTIRQELDPKVNIHISLTNIESLHLYLPRLEYINIDFLLQLIPEKEMETIRNVEPAHNITTMEFVSDTLSTLWIFYLAHKYPNIVGLNLRAPKNLRDDDQIPCDDQKYQSQLRILLSLKQFFPCLQKTSTYINNTNLWLIKLFYDALRHFDVKINYIHIDFEDETPEANDINRWISYFSESVNVLYLEQIDQLDKKRKLLVYCHKLTVLNIYLGGYIDIGNILDYCPVLQSLNISSSDIHSPEYPQPTHLPHSLQTLEIQDTKISQHTFKYISFRCRQLKYMKLYHINFHYSGSDETGQLLVDMPFSQLKTLKAYSNTNHSDDSDIYDYIPVKHIVIEQIENVDSNLLSQNNQGQAPQSNWYHLCADRTNRKGRNLAWELGRRDIEFAQRYYKDFQRRRRREKIRKDLNEVLYGYKPKRFWKRDLQGGVLKLRFKSVKDYFLEEKNEYRNIFRPKSD
ncbi:hypothetical protein J3Q64DRAFT_1850881 [Phycomyces blakesleeanus]|uniref:F-box domain-containing protein n=2 Tax=Phycomyces blakesleeanus TaxID=4837 RepID=A0A167JSY7_PHYB8|nr:hypothetical protein PHYBLDRAFT_152190 [Phycomyces blakesleeanus NRRL 1555(-)]OAD66640.1 hypothetical protein PHYBLDRAFT_152190 [Phycomyces blakesleeanus NRRL 1555(-)]|eukprot:XP_018284680.1 hypothetical protein PHYBLDRAFT_152190 [Phycomyces blakesleeanus NRRL 1555(-)]